MAGRERSSTLKLVFARGDLHAHRPFLFFLILYGSFGRDLYHTAQGLS